MIQHIEATENPNSKLNVRFMQALKALHISSLLPQCGIRKDSRTITGEVSGEKRSAFKACDVRVIELTDALEHLVSIMVDGLANGKITIDESIRMEIIDWYISQPIFIQNICKEQMISAGFINSGDHNTLEISTAA